MILHIFFNFFYFYSLFLTLLGLLWASWGRLGALALLWGPLGAPMSGLTSSAILITGLVQPSVELVKFADFLESTKTIVPKPKLMEDGNRAKMKKTVNVFVS